MGPWIVTRDELKDDDITVKCWVNGELRQSANSKDLIFDVPTLIETISSGITLYPGDIIATGTPAGVGPVQVGDQLVGFIGNEKMLHVEVK